ncbi:MAG: 50S ribosomal protein L23 [Phycisphaerales bacterium]|nr:50S ribosomal protein L23 [Phycisphaerales bacterium]
MKATQIIGQPLISEKSTKLQEKLGQYVFLVNKNANKIEIKKAIQDFYGVKVSAVSTAILPGHNKSKFTKAGFIKGSTASYKKAFVTLGVGEKIDFYASI